MIGSWGPALDAEVEYRQHKAIREMGAAARTRRSHRRAPVAIVARLPRRVDADRTPRAA